MKNRALFILLFLLWPGWAMAEQLFFNAVEIPLQDKKYRLSAQIEYRLSEEANEALNNGVPLTFRVQLVVERVWQRFWENRPLQQALSFQIQYHALTELYRVLDVQTGDEQNFVTQEAALNALGKISNFELVELERLQPGEKYRLRLRADLDIESLPLPLRPLAYLGKGWRLTSGWSQWPLTH